MAKMLEKATITNGRMVKVSNEKRKKFSNAKTEYYAIWVEDHNGKNEKCLLLTEAEIRSAEYRASRNREDLTKKSLINDMLD